MDQYIGRLLDDRYEILEVLGTGGMATKLRAAQMTTERGISMRIMNGSRPYELYDVLDGKSVGTLFTGKRG